MRPMTLVNAVYDPEQKFSPVGPLYIAAVLEEKGRRVDFREYQLNTLANPFDWSEFYTFIDHSEDIIGVHAYSDFLPMLTLALEKLKKEYPDKIIILGGEGPSGAAEEILTHFPFIDIIVIGEGERTIVELMERLDSGGDLSRVKGIGYREGKKVYMNPPREFMEDLDSLPFPDHSKVNLDKYQMVGMTTARGCPFKCAFCDVAPFWGHRFRARSIDNTIEELKLLQDKYHQHAITFYDEIFTLNRKRVLDFCRRLKAENINIKWSCLSRIDSIDETLMETMADSGCFMVSYGIESGSDKIQGLVKKKLKPGEIKEIVSLSVKYFTYIQTFFIWGFPFETMEDFRETMNMISFVSDLGTYPTVGYLAPFPLSGLYKENKKELFFSKEIYLDSHPNKDEEVIRLIETYPDVFPGFYFWKSSMMEEKYRMAKQVGLNTPFLP